MPIGLCRPSLLPMTAPHAPVSCRKPIELGQQVLGRLVGRRVAVPSGLAPEPSTRGRVVSAAMLEVVLRRQLGSRLADQAHVRLSEGLYLLPPLVDLMTLFAASHRDRTQWLEERAACDDFAYALRGEIGAHAFQVGELRIELCLGLAWGCFDWAEGSHAVNWFVSEDGELRFVEPRHDDIYEREHCCGRIDYLFA